MKSKMFLCLGLLFAVGSIDAKKARKTNDGVLPGALVGGVAGVGLGAAVNGGTGAAIGGPIGLLGGAMLGKVFSSDKDNSDDNDYREYKKEKSTRVGSNIRHRHRGVRH
jgi:outer membrane lipoprotein SlyB